MTLRRAAGKKRRIPDRAEDAKSSRTRNKKAKSVERMSDVGLRVAERNNGNCRVLDPSQEWFEGRIELHQHLSCHLGWGGENHVFRRHRIVAAPLQRNVEKTIVLPIGVSGDRFCEGRCAKLSSQSAHQSFVAFAKSIKGGALARSFPFPCQPHHAANDAARGLFCVVELRERAPNTELLRIAGIDT